jgi:acyl dehydratase
VGDPDLTRFEPRPKGQSFEQFEVGQVFEHHWGRTLSEADNTFFTTATLAYNPIYYNAEYARALDYRGTVVNPMLVLCTAVGLSVEDLSEAGGPFLGVNQIRFLEPVYPGDTITARSTVMDARESGSRPDFGIVTWETEATNQEGDVVLRYRRTNLVAKKSANAL